MPPSDPQTPRRHRASRATDARALSLAARRSVAPRIALLALVVGLGACPHAVAPEPEPDPALAVVAYRDALVDGRVADAFALIHVEAREGLDLDGFTLLYRSHRDALVAQAERLVALTRAAPPAERAVVMSRLGASELVRTADGWRLTRPIGTAPADDDPAEPDR